ncbi:MAG: transglutaminase domain-containing protein [Chloroflexota bacterium]
MTYSDKRLQDGWPLLLLAWGMLLIASMAILQADLVDGLHILPIVASLGLFFGWLLAKSHFNDRTAHIFSLIFGIFFVTFLVGTTLDYEGLWRDRVVDLFARQVAWIQKAVGGGTSRDSIIFVLQTTAVFWILGYIAAWFTFRKPYVWRVIVPIGIVLLSVVYYYNGPRPLLLYLAFFTLLALVFVAITHLTSEEGAWRAESIRYDKGIRFDFLRSGLLAALIALLVAWSLPTMQASAAVGDAVSGASGPWRSFQDTWTRLFSSLRTYGTSTSDPYQDSLVLGGPRTVGNTLVMDVYVPEELPYGVYWQAISYDTYADGRWTASDISDEPVVHYPDDGALNVPLTASREVITQTVINYLPNSSFLYAAPEVLNTDKQMLVDGSYDENGDLLVTSLRSRFLLRQGDQYEVLSRVSVADATSLRNSSTAEYPQWVTDRYLQLPDSVTPETIALAADLSQGYDSPFDKAIVIRDYLRSNILYNDQIEAAPDGVDPVDYILFDIQEGYCNYYASAMAVMLRSQGVPTRVVSGYALGDYDEASSSYRVRSSNLHTWVESYFPGYGWIQFEPTSSIPVFDRPESSGAGGDAFATGVGSLDLPDRDTLPEEDVERATSLLNDPSTPEDTGLFDKVPLWQIGIALLILVAAGGALFLANSYNRQIETDVDKSFSRLGNWSSRLGLQWQPNQTPYESAEVLVSAVPAGQEPVRNLTHQYVQKQFSPQQQEASDFDPQQEWRTLRPILIRETIVRYLDRLNGGRKQK